MRLLQHLTHLVAPPVCTLCGGPGQVRDGLWGLDLCSHCEAACPRLAAACPRCALPMAVGPCPHCHAAPPPWQAAFSPFRYASPVDHMIIELKFGHDLAFARVLGTLLARSRAASSTPLPDCLIPLPAHPARYRERGFCQTREIARHTARRLRAAGKDLPVRCDLLQRTRATRAQSGLPDAAARAANLQGAFAVPAGRRVPPRIALLDDVMTTGHTAAAAARALGAAGARHIEIWCCARTLRPAAEGPGPIC